MSICPCSRRSPSRNTSPARSSSGEKKYPLVLELEPLLQCNLACAGCGKIQHPDDILRRRLSVEECIAAVEECGAPMVSIAGGEPLVHEQMPQIVEELVKRKKFVFLCTNALLLKKKIDHFKPSIYFAWMIHLDGMRERHDQSVCRDGVFDKAVDAIKEAKARGFRVFTNTTFFDQDGPESIREVLDYLNDELKVDMMQISPAYAYEKAPDQEHFLGVKRTREVFQRKPSPAASARSGASTTARSTSTSSKAKSTSSARRGAFRATRCSAGSVRAT